MTTLTLAEIQPFIDFVNGNLGLKPYTLQSLSTWASSAGKPLVASGNGYGVVLGDFPATGVTTINGRSGAVTLDSTDVGLGNVPNVNCTDASNITSGTLPLSVIPAAALERLVHVADEAARFLLTTAEVQNGDIVQQDDTGIMYKVVDDTNLGNAAGYNEFTAGIAAAVNWSGIFGMPQAIIDVAASSGVAKDMLVYLAGHWVTQTPAQVRSNLDIPVKGTWDMSDTIVSTPITEYPMPIGGTAIGANSYEVVSPDVQTHSTTLAYRESSAQYYALTDNLVNAVILQTQDTAGLPLPTSGVSAVLLEVNEPSILPSTGTFSHSLLIGGARQAANEHLWVQATIAFSAATGVQAQVYVTTQHGTTSVYGSVSVNPLVSAPFHRIVVYFEGSTGRIGAVVDGVDHGWVRDVGNTVDLAVPASISAIDVGKITAFDNLISNSDPALGQALTTRHSILTSDITETLPSILQPWTTSLATPPSLPVGAEVTNRFRVSVAGTFNGVSAQVDDIVEVLSPIEIFVYPKAGSLARLTDLSGYATTANLSNVQNDVINLNDSLTALDDRVVTLENGLSTIDNRTEREKFLTGTGRIVGASSNGNDLHAGFANEEDAVIVTSFTDTYVGVTGQFTGFPVGSLAVRRNDYWVNFVPQPGDEYTFISKMYASDYPNTGQLIPLVFKMTYVGGSPGTGLPGVDSGGTFISPQFTSGYQDRTPLAWEASYAQYGGAFHQLGWLMHPQANGPRGERVKYILVPNSYPVEVNPLSDDVVYIRNSTLESVVDINVVMPKPTDQVGDRDRTYSYILTGAAKKTRVIIEGAVASNTFPVYVRQYATLGELAEGGRNVPVAHFLYRSVQASNPSDNAPSNLVYDPRGMVLDVWIDPSSDGTSIPQPTVRVERKDHGGKVFYEPPQSAIYAENRSTPDIDVLHWEGYIFGQYISALGRNVAWMLLPPPTQEGTRLLVRVPNGYRDPNGPNYDVIWTTEQNDSGLSIGFKAGTTAAMPTKVEAGQFFEFVCVRQTNTEWPEVTLTSSLVWSWVRPVADNLKIAKYEEGVSYWSGQWWTPDTPSNQREVSLSGVASFGYPFTIGLDTPSLLSQKEGEVVTIRVKSDDNTNKFIPALQFRKASANTVDLPGTIPRRIWAPFDIITSFKMVNGSLELLSQTIVSEKRATEVLVTPISRESSFASASIWIAGGGPSSEGWPPATKVPAPGSYSVATHRVTVQAYSGNTRAYFKEVVVRVSCDGATTTKVAETVVYEDKDNVTTEISVAVDAGGFLVGDGTAFLAVVGTSNVVETIRWSGRIESVYSN